jgi:hypothetical protein
MYLTLNMQAKAYLACIAVMLWAQASRGEGDITARWKTEAPRAWAAIDDYMSRVSCTIEVSTRSNTKHPPGHPRGGCERERFRCSRNGDWILVEFRQEQFRGQAFEEVARTKFSEKVYGMNSRYAFQIARHEPEDKFVLAHLGPAGPVVEGQFPGLAKYLLRHVRSPAHRIVEWLANPSISIRELEPDERAGKVWVRLRFHYHDRTGQYCDSEGEIWFDPSRSWTVQEARVTSATQVNELRIDFMDSSDGFPIPVRLVSRLRSPDMPEGEWSISEAIYRDFKRVELPEHQFAVSAYGLPEIDPAIKRPWPVWLWCILLSVVAALAMLLFRWFARRKAAVTA